MPWNPYTELRYVPLFTPVVDEVGAACARAYGLLATYCRQDGQWTGQCAPSLDRLAEQLGTDRRRLRRSLKELEQAGWVAVDRTPNAKGRPSVYRLVDPGARSTPGADMTPGPEAPRGQSDPGVVSTPSPGVVSAPSPGVVSAPQVDLSVEKLGEKAGETRASARAATPGSNQPQGPINPGADQTPGSFRPPGSDSLMLFAAAWCELTERGEFKDYVAGHGQLSGTEQHWLMQVRKLCSGSATEFRARVSARLAADKNDFLRQQTPKYWLAGPLQAPAGAAKGPARAPTVDEFNAEATLG